MVIDKVYRTPVNKKIKHEFLYDSICFAKINWVTENLRNYNQTDKIIQHTLNTNLKSQHLYLN